MTCWIKPPSSKIPSTNWGREFGSADSTDRADEIVFILVKTGGQQKFHKGMIMRRNLFVLMKECMQLYEHMDKTKSIKFEPQEEIPKWKPKSL